MTVAWGAASDETAGVSNGREAGVLSGTAGLLLSCASLMAEPSVRGAGEGVVSVRTETAPDSMAWVSSDEETVAPLADWIR